MSPIKRQMLRYAIEAYNPNAVFQETSDMNLVIELCEELLDDTETEAKIEEELQW